MNKLLVLMLSLLLAGCGGSDSADDSASINIAECDRSDINSQVYCKLTADYLWYDELKS